MRKSADFHSENFSRRYGSGMDMAEKLANRSRFIKRRMQDLEISTPELARRMGSPGDQTSVERLHKIINGKVDQPRGSVMADLAKALGVTEEILRRAAEEPLIVESDDPDSVHAALGDQVPRGMVEIDMDARLGGGAIAPTRMVRRGDDIDPVKEDPWIFPRSFMQAEMRANPSRVIVVETKGDSMEPTIHSGDRVFVDTGHRMPSPDGVYALRDQYGGLVVKRLQVLRGGDPPVVRIISDNPNHAAEDVPATLVQDEIIGKVLFGLRRF